MVLYFSNIFVDGVRFPLRETKGINIFGLEPEVFYQRAKLSGVSKKLCFFADSHEFRSNINYLKVVIKLNS